MNIVITGAGYLGSALAEHFFGLGHTVTVVSGEETCPFVLNGVKYVHEDLRLGCEKLKESLDGADVCICTAAVCGVLEFAYDTRNCYNNTLIDQNSVIALSSVENGPKRVFYFSSSEVYGPCTNAREGDSFKIEQTNRGSYATEKALGEFLFNILCHRGIDVCVIRPFNVVGSYSQRTGNQKIGHILPNFIRAVKNGRMICLYNNESRCYIDIHDFCAAIAKILETRQTEKFTVYNIGNPKNKYTNDEVAEMVKEISGADVEIKYVPALEIAPISKRKPNITKLQKIYKPKTSLVSSIKSML